jgi:spore maturation protein CgeB
MRIVIYGLTITSSWGNGHATTYRSLIKALARRGHRVHFIEKEREWYRSNRDLPQPEFCTVQLYDEWSMSATSLLQASIDADAIVIGSYFPDAVKATKTLLDMGYGPVLFYDIDTPITMSQLRAYGATDYLEASLIPHYAAYLSFTGGPVLKELEERFGSPWAVPFYCSVDPDLYRPKPVNEI